MGSTSYPDRRHFHAVSVRILINGTCNLLASNAIYYQLLELMQMDALFFQKSLQVGLVVADTARRVIAVHGLTSLVDQELLVVPADVAVAHRSVIQVGAVEEDVTCRWTASLQHSSSFLIFISSLFYSIIILYYIIIIINILTSGCVRTPISTLRKV